MNESYQIAQTGTNVGSKELSDFLTKEGQLLLPMVQLIEDAEVAIDDLVDVMGRATIEAVLLMSAQQVAGPKQRGKARPSDSLVRVSKGSSCPERTPVEGGQAPIAQQAGPWPRRRGRSAGVRDDA